MIQEAYCSYEVSKLLKEKGFLKGVNLRLIPNIAFYDNIGLRYNVAKWYDSLIQDKIDFVVAPTQQMAMRWLREIHDIKIMIRPYVDGTYSYEILNGFWHVNFDSYEDAAEEAIKYCLEYLI